MKRTITLILSLLTLTTALPQGWPERYDGVMLQGFYWDSYSDTRWEKLESQADELSQYFSLIWVPQSGYCNTTSMQMGYLPVWWFNHLSAFGSEQQLRSMIKTFKEHGTGIIEDVVINHRNGNTNWCDFPTETWNGHTMTWSLADICKGDDGGKTEKQGYKLAGAADTGDDFDGGRDIDHTSTNAQENIKVYLDFLLNDLGYAGFRYDMVKGYAPKYTAMYNQSAKPQFSVGECWDGYAVVTRWIDSTKVDGIVQSAAFDFPMKYAINTAFASGGNWSSLNVSTLTRSDAYRRYAVTFVDNHDTYRDQNQLKANIEAANAYMLTMPGTPCVFLRHWQMFRVPIKKMIFTRKAAGVHSQSETLEQQAYDNGYVVRTQGTKGTMMVVLGSVPSLSLDGYTLAVKGTNYALYVSDDVDLKGIEDIKETEEEKVNIPDFCQLNEGEMAAFFEAPKDWTAAIRCWAWNGSTNFTGGTWPGAQCVKVGTAANGCAVYKWEGGQLGALQPSGIIFSSNGSPQTPDLDFHNGGYYTIDGFKGDVLAVKAVGADKAKSGQSYDLSGRRLPSTTRHRGIYILDGKKHLKTN